MVSLMVLVSDPMMVELMELTWDMQMDQCLVEQLDTKMDHYSAV